MCEAKDAYTRKAQFDRALKWLLAFQDEDGGWAAFDKGVTALARARALCRSATPSSIPPAQTSPGRVLELLGYIGYDRQSHGRAPRRRP